jgi:hypothetical protein
VSQNSAAATPCPDRQTDSGIPARLTKTPDHNKGINNLPEGSSNSTHPHPDIISRHDQSKYDDDTNDVEKIRRKRDSF